MVEESNDPLTSWNNYLLPLLQQPQKPISASSRVIQLRFLLLGRLRAIDEVWACGTASLLQHAGKRWR